MSGSLKMSTKMSKNFLFVTWWKYDWQIGKYVFRTAFFAENAKNMIDYVEITHYLQRGLVLSYSWSLAWGIIICFIAFPFLLGQQFFPTEDDKNSHQIGKYCQGNELHVSCQYYLSYKKLRTFHKSFMTVWLSRLSEFPEFNGLPGIFWLYFLVF